MEIARQLVRSSGSVGANYIEANESLGEKDFAMRIKIMSKRSEGKPVLASTSRKLSGFKDSQTHLIQESTELMKIFGAILEKIKQRQQPNE